jgi:hypothetical protein
MMKPYYEVSKTDLRSLVPPERIKGMSFDLGRRVVDLAMHDFIMDKLAEYHEVGELSASDVIDYVDNSI